MISPRRAILILGAGFMVSILAYFIPTFSAQAASCSNMGMFNSFTTTTNILTPGSNALIEATFKWRPGTDPSCYDNEVTVYFFGSKTSGSGYVYMDKAPQGKLGLGDLKVADFQLSYDNAKNIVGDNAAIFVKAVARDAGDVLADDSGDMAITVQGADTAYACVDKNGKFACSSDRTLDGCNRNFACQPAGEPRDSSCRPVVTSLCNQIPQCRLTSVSWSSSSFSTGQPVLMYIRGQDCNGYTASVRIYGVYEGGGGEITGSGGLIARFVSPTEARLTFTFTSGDFGPGSGNSIEVSFRASANDTEQRSGLATLTKGSVTPGFTPTSTSGPGGQTTTFDFSIPNPLKSENLLELIEAVGGFIFALAIPVAVIMIIIAGVMFLVSRGDQAKVTQARKILWYAVIGLAIVLIGSGFVSLITSILDLGGTTP